MLDRSYEAMILEQQHGESSNGINNDNRREDKLNIENLVTKFSENTLFFIFYYQQNTYKQNLAAQELTKRKW